MSKNERKEATEPEAAAAPVEEVKPAREPLNKAKTSMFGSGDGRDLNMPLAACRMGAFVEAINEIHAECGGEGFVTFEAFSALFDWPEFQDPESLHSKFYKRELAQADDENKLTMDNLLLWGIVHCKEADGFGSAFTKVEDGKEKGKALFNCLQDGGADAHKIVSAGDKDWEPVTQKLFDLALVDVKTGEPQTFLGDKKADVYEMMLEDDLKENVFGVNSNVSFESFYEAFGKESHWCQSDEEIQAKMKQRLAQC